MSYLNVVPPPLLELTARPQFIDWLKSVPVPFHDKLRCYFAWLDYNDAAYTDPDLIDLRKSAVPPHD